MLGLILSRYHRCDVGRRVRRFGWTGIYVGDYVTAPTWAYTIGFRSSAGAPEVIAFDLPERTANAVFHEIFHDLTKGDLVMRDGELWRPEDSDGRMVFRRVHPSRLCDNDPEQPWLGLAETFDPILTPEAGEFEAFQLVLSDAQARLPWDAGYDERLRPRQRALWKPLELAAADMV